MANSKKEDSKAASGIPSLDDLGKLLEQVQLPGVDVAAIVESQRKDMEALAEANRQAYEGMKALAERRNEMLKDALAPWQQAVKDVTDPAAVSKQAEKAQQGVQQAIDNFRELAEMEAQSRNKAWKVVQDRMQENLANLQRLMQPK